MKDTISMLLFQALSPAERLKFGKFLHSPYFNHRSDVKVLYQILQETAEEERHALKKEAVFVRVYPDKPYDRQQCNLLLNWFSERLEQFLACQELLDDRLQNRLLRCRAFRKRGLGKHFEENVHELERAHLNEPYRNAGFWLFEYQVQNEIFSYQIVQRRSGQTNLLAVTGALTNFYLLENLKWSGTTHSLEILAREPLPPVPMASEALEAVANIEEAVNPALALMHAGYLALQNPDDEAQFQRLKHLLRSHVHLFPPAESRDLYMTAINFAIRQNNRGQRAYTAEAFELYREALEKDILLESGQLAIYTYINILNLAQLNGENDWALQFLHRYRNFLPAAERENGFRYALASYHFRRSEYRQVLELLREVEFSEVFVHLDARKMLLRSYFELQEWLSLASLLDSFKAYVRRQKELGYHRDSYLNLIRFTKKLARPEGLKKARAGALAHKIRETKLVAERDWLLGKLDP